MATVTPRAYFSVERVAEFHCFSCNRLRKQAATVLATTKSQTSEVSLEAKKIAVTSGKRANVSMLRPISSKPFLAAALAFSLSVNGIGYADARPEGVNRPDLLPTEFTPVIDAAGYLSAGQVVRITKEVTHLEEETGFKLRVLAQNYPNTPGLAIKDFWKVDDNTVIFVADPSLGGNILNFNVGAAVDLNVPHNFWTRLAGKYGNIFYWQEKGEDASIEAAVSAIATCLREPPGPRACSNIH